MIRATILIFQWMPDHAVVRFVRESACRSARDADMRAAHAMAWPMPSAAAAAPHSANSSVSPTLAETTAALTYGM